MPRYNIKHATAYHYDFPVTISHHSAHVKPMSSNEQTCDTFNISVDPASEEIESREDYFGNTVHMFSIQEMHQSFTVETESYVNVHSKSVDLTKVKITCREAQEYFEGNHPSDILAVREYAYATEVTAEFPGLLTFSQSLFEGSKPLGTSLLEALETFKNEFEFDARATEVFTPISQVLRTRRGVCQDYAHLLIAALRSVGLSAKYVSGYILSTPPKGMPRLIGADASHAWVSVFIPHTGWVEIDPTNNLVCSSEHVRVAYGRDYSDIPMIKGAVTGGGKHSISVEVTMMPVAALSRPVSRQI